MNDDSNDVIVLVDSDDDENNVSTGSNGGNEKDSVVQTALSSLNDGRLSTSNQQSLDAFRSILPHITHDAALQLLKDANWNVEFAVNSALEDISRSGLGDHIHMKQDEKVKGDLKATIREPSSPSSFRSHHDELQKPTPKIRIPAQGLASMTSAHIPPAKRKLPFDDEKVSAANRSTDHTPTVSSSSSLDPAWYACMKRAQIMSDQHFVDSDFAPTLQSLDGRKRSPTNVNDGNSSSRDGENNENTDTILCRCGLRAAAKQVQTDGPNYGRFYLSCGQVQRRRARVVPLRQKTRRHQNDKDDADEPQNTNNAKNNASNPNSVKAEPETTTVKAIRNPYAKQQTTRAESPPKTASTTTSPSSPPTPQRRNCNFFQWDAHGALGAALQNYNRPMTDDDDGACGYESIRRRKVSWFRFGLEQQCVLYHKGGMAASHVRQGAVGNCWFLSALAVVAEKPYLMQAVVPHSALNDAGCYQINLFLDGMWQAVIVDSYLPIVLAELDGSKKNGTMSRDGASRLKDGIPVQVHSSKDRKVAANSSPSKQPMRSSSTTVLALPAFCAAPERQLWPCLVEKAYAKAHGSYQQLSGGFIAEGLQDLTGAPTETIVFQAGFVDVDTFWARLLSFGAAGFLMGVATAQGGEGLVGGHAYSVLDVLEVPDTIVGEQCKVTDYFRPQKKSAKVVRGGAAVADDLSDECIPLDNGNTDATTNAEPRGTTRTTLRLVRIRNPWGKREWKGDWSADSEQWTRALRKKLGASSFVKGDGTFYMAYEDMLQRFHHMDVAKTQSGWLHSSVAGTFSPSFDPLSSSPMMYTFSAAETTQAFVTIIQPKKRSNTQTKYWYCDSSMILMRRLTVGHDDEWQCVACVLAGVRRQVHVDLFIETGYTYICLPISCLATKKLDYQVSYPFRIATYSSKALRAEEFPSATETSSSARRVASTMMQKELLSKETKLIYPLTKSSSLICAHGEGALYFLAINGALDQYLSIRLTIELPDGLLVVFGRLENSIDIPPNSQRLLAVVSTNGKQSLATSFNFRYVCSTVQAVSARSTQPSPQLCCRSHGNQDHRLGAVVPLSLAGDLLTSHTDPGTSAMSGGSTIDTYMWIPQLGAA